MPSAPEAGQDERERFRDRYRTSGEAAVRLAELDALGSDYRANGYTTLNQAGLLARRLDLQADDLLIDLGSGCGWPGLYLAAETGCPVITIDPVHEGITVARERAIADGFQERCSPVVADAEHIPLRARSVDAIVHTDLLC